MDFEGAFFNTSDYELTKQNLGHGTFGTVYIAKSRKDGNDYAVKILKAEDGFNGDQQMYLMRESMILRELHHPSIVQFIGINFQSFSDPNKLEPSIITKYLSNGSLKAALDAEKKSLANPSWNPTKKYISLLGIASAMKYLHQHKIIHRDLKPENILMDENYYPQVCDFGLSRCLPDSYAKSLKMTENVGSPLYMAPELLEGETHYDTSVDVYAFAILAYEIVTGKEPFYETPNLTPFKLAAKVMNGSRPTFSNDATEKMIGLLSKCWSQDPSERPSFDEIYTLLSNDFSYLDEPVDEEEVNEYIENTLNEVIKNSKYDPDEDFFNSLSLLHGYKENRNFNEAVNELKSSSKRGSSLSSFLLGLMHESGEIEQNFEMAKFYYTKSSEQGNSNAMRRLGMCYLNGCGVDIDYSEAVQYLQKSAEQGNSRALSNLGLCYESGYGVEKDHYKAFEFTKKAAELGNLSALNNLGVYYKNGTGVEQDTKKAVELYQKAAELGNAPALKNLGSCYENGIGVDQDYRKAVEYYQKACDIGHPRAYYNLGMLYESGKGVEQDISKAIELYEKAASKGFTRAQQKISKLKK